MDEHSGTAARARIAVETGQGVGIPDHFFVKFTPHSYIQHVMMNLFELGTREVLAYRALGDRPPVRVPHCYAARVDELRGRSILVLEDLSGKALFRTVCDNVTPSEAEAVVDAMAEQHIAFWESARFDHDLAAMTRRPKARNVLGDRIRRRFVGNMKGHTAELVPTDIKSKARILFERSAEIDAMWDSQPRTLLHGDPHLGNLFFEGDHPGFFDWQVATAGCGMRDVSYFANVSVEPDTLRRIEKGLVERYAGRLDARGIAVDVEHLWMLYKAGATEIFLSAVAAAEAGERAQPLDVTRAAVSRCVASLEALDSLGALASLVDNRSR